MINQISVTFPQNFLDERYTNRNQLIEWEDIQDRFNGEVPTNDMTLLQGIEDELDLERNALSGMAIKRTENVILVFPDPVFGHLPPEFLEKKLSPIINGTITGIALEPDYEDDSEKFWGLSVENLGRLFTLWILRDDEGNGPGSFELQEEPQDDR